MGEDTTSSVNDVVDEDDRDVGEVHEDAGDVEEDAEDDFESQIEWGGGDFDHGNVDRDYEGNIASEVDTSCDRPVVYGSVREAGTSPCDMPILDGSVGDANVGTCNEPVADASVRKMSLRFEENEMRVEVLDGDGGCDNENNVAQEVGGRRCRRFDGDDVTKNEKIVAGVMEEGVIGEYV